MSKRISEIELTPNYGEDGLQDVTLHIEYSDGTGGGDVIPAATLGAVLELLRRVSPIGFEALMVTWAP